MNLTEILAAFQAAMKAVTGLTDLVAKHEAKITALEAQVQAHDKELKTAPLPGAPPPTGRT